MGKSFMVAKVEKENIEFDITLPEQRIDDENAEGGFRVEDVTEKFHARPAVPGALMVDVAASGAAATEYQAAALRRFLHYAIMPEDRDRFWRVVEDSWPPVTMQTLSEIVGNLMEEYSDRPTNKS